MAVNAKFDDISNDDLYAVGERNDVPGYKRVVREVRSAVDAWRTFGAVAEVSEDVLESIEADMTRFRPA